MEEVDATKRARDYWEDRMARSTLDLHTSLPTHMREDFTLTTVANSELSIVRMSREVLQAVTASAKESKSLIPLLSVATSSVAATELDGTTKEVADKAS